MHPQAQIAMRSKLEALLSSSRFDTSFPRWETRLLDAFAKEAIKGRAEWISQRDVFIILHQQVSAAVGIINVARGGALGELLGPEGLKRLVESILAEFEAIPREYVVYIPLPNVHVPRPLDLTPDISLTPIQQSKNILASLSQPIRALEHTHVGTAAITFLSVPARGYASYGWTYSSAMREAAAITRRVFQVALLKGVLASWTGSSRRSVYSLGFAPPEMQELEAVACQKESPTIPVARAFIDANTASYLKGHTNAESDEGAQEKAYKSLFLIIGALTNEPADENTKSIRSALEWAFDAASDPDPASSFVKTCIGLEAALGEENDTEDLAITERLADRCAFLLNKTAADRAATRVAMKKVYKLRSKIVHGVKRRLNNDDEDSRLRGQMYLDLVLSTEMRAIEAWHVRQGAKAADKK